MTDDNNKVVWIRKKLTYLDRSALSDRVIRQLFGTSLSIIACHTVWIQFRQTAKYGLNNLPAKGAKHHYFLDPRCLGTIVHPGLSAIAIKVQARDVVVKNLRHHKAEAQG